MFDKLQLALRVSIERWLDAVLESSTLRSLRCRSAPLPAYAVATARAIKSKRGVTAIEYGLIAALIAVAIIVAVTLVGTNLQLTFNMISGHLGNSPH